MVSTAEDVATVAQCFFSRDAEPWRGSASVSTAAIAAEALGKDNVLGVLMPSQYSLDHSIQDALDLAKNLGMKTETVFILTSS